MLPKSGGWLKLLNPNSKCKLLYADKESQSTVSIFQIPSPSFYLPKDLHVHFDDAVGDCEVC